MEDRLKQLLTFAKEHYERAEYAQAEPYLNQIYGITHKYADVCHMLGVVHHDRGDFEGARSYFEQALLINPNYTEAALNLAITYNELGLYDKAQGVFQGVKDSGHAEHSQDPFVRGRIANLHAGVAKAYEDAGMLAEALNELRKAILLCPTFIDLRMKLASLYRQKGELHAARFEIQEILQQRPTFANAHVALGVTLLALGERTEAIRAWEKALNIDPDNTSAKMYLRASRSAAPPSRSVPPDPKR